MRRILVLLFFCLSIQKVWTQCLSAPSEPDCNPPGSSELVDNDVASAGETLVVSGASSFSNLTMDGGTLIICGNLTLPALTFNSGSIYIKSGASIDILNSGAIVFGPNSRIYNYGTFTSTQIIVPGQDNIIFNCLTTSVFNQYAWLVIQGPNASIVNNGLMDYLGGGIVAENVPNSFCLGAGSEVKTSVLEVRYPNVFDAPSGPACVYVRDRVTNSQTLTQSSNVHICKGPSATESGDYGNATVVQNCNSCSTVLPVTLTSFYGFCSEGINYLTWSTSIEIMNDHFKLERSADGVKWEYLSSIKGFGTSFVSKNYFYEDNSFDPSTIKYYRLKQADWDGKEIISKVITVGCGKTEVNDETFELYPNPLYSGTPFYIQYRGDRDGKMNVILVNSLGQYVYETEIQLSKEQKQFNLDIPELADGVYWVQLLDDKHSPYSKKMLYVRK